MTSRTVARLKCALEASALTTFYLVVISGPTWVVHGKVLTEALVGGLAALLTLSLYGEAKARRGVN